MGQVSDELLRLKSENIRLKWIVAQMMQRWSTNGFVLLHMENPVQFGISIHESPERKLIEVRTKRITDTNVPETPGHVNPN